MRALQRCLGLPPIAMALLFFVATFALFSSVLGLGFILYEDP